MNLVGNILCLGKSVWRLFQGDRHSCAECGVEALLYTVFIYSRSLSRACELAELDLPWVTIAKEASKMEPVDL